MSDKSLPTKIIEAIKAEDVNELYSLFDDNPEQKSFYTFIGGQTWLGYSAQLGKLESVKALLEIGININTGDKREDIKPICSAACKHFEVTKYLFEQGAVLDVSLSVRNPLFAAIVGNATHIVKFLLESGIDSKKIYNSESMTKMDALAFAVMRGQIDSAKIIANWNSDSNEIIAAELLEKAEQIAKINAYKSKP